MEEYENTWATFKQIVTLALADGAISKVGSMDLSMVERIQNFGQQFDKYAASEKDLVSQYNKQFGGAVDEYVCQYIEAHTENLKQCLHAMKQGAQEMQSCAYNKAKQVLDHFCDRLPTEHAPLQDAD
eukprot:9411724-Karenia_brevis.AAC.1